VAMSCFSMSLITIAGSRSSFPIPIPRQSAGTLRNI
jgi:hypothetical protein